MIVYKRCSEVDIDKVYEAFKGGFSDYIIKLDVPKDFFISRFLGSEGNSLEYSFVALDDEKPIGVVLGGIKNYEGIKTIRCGTMAVIPEYRGMGVSQKLMELHREEGRKQKCIQMFLEVIVGNDRAINFYNKLGYQKVYDIFYFTLNEIEKLNRKCSKDVDIKPVDFNELASLRQKTLYLHNNWQNDVEHVEKSTGQTNMGAYIGDKLVGLASVNKNSRINFIWVESNFRNNGIAAALLKKAADELNLSKLSIGTPNNAAIYGFLQHIGFVKDKISQYEMYYTL